VAGLAPRRPRLAGRGRQPARLDPLHGLRRRLLRPHRRRPPRRRHRQPGTLTGALCFAIAAAMQEFEHPLAA